MPDDARARHAARERRQHERRADHLAHRLRLQPLQHRGERKADAPSPAPPDGEADVARRLADLPPIGNHPVRAATNTRNNDVSSGGIDSRTSEMKRIVPDSGPRRLPLTTPSGSPTTVATASAVSARTAVFAARPGISSRTGRS